MMTFSQSLPLLCLGLNRALWLWSGREMKRIYSLLPASLVKRIRGVIEFDGGVTDTYLLSARSGHAQWDIISQGTTKNYRTPPA